MRADSGGSFRFTGLAPGDYRVMSTYDFREVDEEAMTIAAPNIIHLSAGQTETVSLAIFESR